jgi:hypothetical protein
MQKWLLGCPISGLAVLLWKTLKESNCLILLFVRSHCHYAWLAPAPVSDQGLVSACVHVYFGFCRYYLHCHFHYCEILGRILLLAQWALSARSIHDCCPARIQQGIVVELRLHVVGIGIKLGTGM